MSYMLRTNLSINILAMVNNVPDTVAAPANNGSTTIALNVSSTTERTTTPPPNVCTSDKAKIAILNYFC